jgi:hypothetical protein
MLQPKKDFTALLLCVAPLMTALSCLQTGSGQAFLEGRTGIAVTEAPICGAGVADYDRCRPRDMGGSHWEQAANFPSYSVPHRLARGGNIERIMAEVRAHYLGSPFYAGDVHSVCKDDVDEEVFPEGGTTLQEYDLALAIEDRAVKPVASRVRRLLQERETGNASALTRRFENHLMDEVRERVQARVLWFVTRYPGGLADLSRERQLRKCLQEGRSRNAQLVTGVAGYMVMDNKIDSAIGSQEVVNRALELALRGHDDDIQIEPEFRHALGAEWHGRVSEVAQIKMPRRDMTATAWPLWVQFQ